MAIRPYRIFASVLFALLAAGCSSHGGSALVPPHAQLSMPASVSPGSIVPPPMAVTAIQPAGAMQSPSGSGMKPMGAIQGPNYTQLPGAAIFAAGAADGSLWVLSNLPSGPDKYIWHFANGAWTNISGLANHISVAPDLSLYASNSAGGAYHYASGNWIALGGGVSDIAAASDNSLYVLSNSQPAGNDQAVWHYTTSWSQIPGAGVRIAASVDVGSHVIPGGIVGPGGIYIVNSIGSILLHARGRELHSLSREPPRRSLRRLEASSSSVIRAAPPAPRFTIMTWTTRDGPRSAARASRSPRVRRNST